MEIAPKMQSPEPFVPSLSFHIMLLTYKDEFIQTLSSGSCFPLEIVHLLFLTEELQNYFPVSADECVNSLDC